MIEDEPLIFECILTKDRDDDQVTWLFNGEPLVIDQERVKVTKVGPIVKLSIDECQLTDDGRYTAEINGKTTKANVIVKGQSTSFQRISNHQRQFVSREKDSIHTTIERYRIR